MNAFVCELYVISAVSNVRFFNFLPLLLCLLWTGYQNKLALVAMRTQTPTILFTFCKCRFSYVMYFNIFKHLMSFDFVPEENISINNIVHYIYCEMVKNIQFIQAMKINIDIIFFKIYI